MSSKIKFNRNSGIAVSQVMAKMAKELENETLNMLNALRQLHEYYKDEGYDAHSTNITAALRTMSDTCTSFNEMSKALNSYTNKLFG